MSSGVWFCRCSCEQCVSSSVCVLFLQKHIKCSSEALCASCYLAGAIYCSWIPVSKGSNQSYATDLSFMEKNVSVKLVACWTTDHQHLRKALIVIILMLWGECCKNNSWRKLFHWLTPTVYIFIFTAFSELIVLWKKMLHENIWVLASSYASLF